MLEEIENFIYNYKNKSIEASEIATFKDIFSKFSQDLINTNYYKEFYENYLNIRGYTYRVDNPSLRLFYTFQEAVYAIDLAKLTKDEEGVKLNSIVYALVINDLIKEYLGEKIDENIKNEAIAFYKKEQLRVSKENQKYHMYQN